MSVLIVTLLVTTLSSCGTVKKVSTTAGDAAQGGGTYLQQAIPANVLGLSLVDQNGKNFTLGSLAGNYLIVTNFLTSCQEICPMTTTSMRDIAAAVEKAGAAKKIKVLEISVDAQRDTASRMKAYQDLYGSSNWTLASGNESDLVTLWKYFGAPATRMEISRADAAKMPVDWQTGKPASYDLMHANLVLIIDDQSRWRWLDLGAPSVGKGIVPEKLKAYLTEEGIKNLSKPDGSTWSKSAVYSAINDLSGIRLS